MVVKVALVLMALALKCIDLLMMLLGCLIFPIAYTSRKDLGYVVHFPKWAWLWDNDDHGIDGQSFYAKKTQGWSYARRCFTWSCLRNSTFNFSKFILGIPFHSYLHEGDVGIGDKKKGGSYWCFIEGTPFFEYYLIAPYGSRCLRVRVGWKIYGKTIGDHCQFCFVINPLMPYSGN